MGTPPIDWEFRLGNIYFNTAQEPDDDGCLWGINCPLSGWDDGAGYRGTSSDVPFSDGADVPDQYLGARIIHATGLIVAPDVGALERARRRLLRETRLLRSDGYFYDRPPDLGGLSRFCSVRRGGQTAFPARHAPNGDQQAIGFDFLLIASDPLKYSASAQTVPVTSATNVGGITFPVTFPVTFTSDEDIANDPAVSTNTGDIDVGFVVQFNGPLANPILIDRLTSRRIALNATIGPSQQVVVDTRDETITLGGESVYDWLDGSSTNLDEFVIPAEGECDWLLLGQGDGEVTVISRSAWE